jgi:hypothetical protein
VHPRTCFISEVFACLRVYCKCCHVHLYVWICVRAADRQLQRNCRALTTIANGNDVAVIKATVSELNASHNSTATFTYTEKTGLAGWTAMVMVSYACMTG